MAATKTRKRAAPPWRKKNPKSAAGKSSKKLSTGQKKSAKARAKKAGRPYPNLVDNMHEASKKKSTKKKATKKKSTKKKAAKKKITKKRS